MKNKLKLILLFALAVISVMLATSCSGDGSPYADYDDDGYKVSVKYDANGGTFTTDTSVIVDTYATDALPTDSEGNKIVTLFAPDDEARKEINRFTPQKSGYFLLGWYTERTPVTDANGNQLDVDGNIAIETGKELLYTYSGKWDFENDKLKIGVSNDSTATEPAVTLYAGWVKNFIYEFYYEGEMIGSYQINPLYASDIAIPSWDTSKGTLTMHHFPTVKNKTFEAVYTDAGMTEIVTGETVKHCGTLDIATATATNTTMKLYLDMKDGEWFRIYTASQLLKNAQINGCYEIAADLDFDGSYWPSSFSAKNFSGTILGGGHKISNVKIEQTNTSEQYVALFGQLTDKATVKDVSFENINITVSKGTRMPIARYGIFAGVVSEGATVSGVSIVNSTLYLDPTATFASDIEIGLVAGLGYEYTGIDYSSIQCVAVEKENAVFELTITVDGNSVTVTQTLKSDD